MRLKSFTFACLCLLGIQFLGSQSKLGAQQAPSTEKVLHLSARAARDHDIHFHLLTTEEDQEPGNAVPVLLRMTYEQQPWMKEFYPKLGEFAAMDVNDPKLHELYFNRFAEQIIRAGSMKFADWEYPLRSQRPYLIMLPDIQSQRQLTGRGMTAWVKQRLSKGEIDKALTGIKAQLGCARHCASTPIVVCHLVGLAIANMAFDNLEIAIQSGDCPNMYWSLATLSPTLQDLGPMVRWELWATPSHLNEPLPPVGDERWTRIAADFVAEYAEVSSEIYSKEEGENLQSKMERIATQELSKSLGYAEAEMKRMTTDERIMRWINLYYCRFRSQVEPLTYQSPLQILAFKNKIEAANKDLLAATGAKSSPYPVSLPQGILACRSFERRVKFLQCIEALRDHASKHQGRFPSKLDELDLAAPNDPFTGVPFVYEGNVKSARLRQAEIEGYTTSVYDYELTVE